jgi:hypothetical protein
VTMLSSLLDKCADLARWSKDVEERFGSAAEFAIQMRHLDLDPEVIGAVGAITGDPRHHGARVFVTAPMVELCRAAERALQREAPLLSSDLPWVHATVVFEKEPWFVTDGTTGQRMAAEVVQWHTTYIRVDEGVDVASSGPGVRALSWARVNGRLVPNQQTRWVYGELPTGRGDTADHATVHRMLFVLWSMLRDHIAIATITKPPRPSARRWERQTKLPSGDIIVITLRRPQSRAHDNLGNIIDWSHQWIVDGHWRQQWYPSLNAHRPRWIAPYVKGPEDKPLVVKEKVFAWIR